MRTSKVLVLIPGHLDYGVSGSAIFNTETVIYLLDSGCNVDVVTQIKSEGFKVADNILRHRNLHLLRVFYSDSLMTGDISIPEKRLDSYIEASSKIGIDVARVVQCAKLLSAYINIRPRSISCFISGPDHFWPLCIPDLLGELSGLVVWADDISSRLLHSAFVLPTSTKEDADGVLANIRRGQIYCQAPILLHKLYKDTNIVLASFSIAEARRHSVPGFGHFVNIKLPVPFKSLVKYPRHKRIPNVIDVIHIGNLGTAASSSFLQTLSRALSDGNSSELSIRINLVGVDKTWIPLSHLTGILPPNIKIKTYGWLNEEQLSELASRMDIALSFSNYPVGIRTRIVDYLSRGLPVIAHVASSESLPGLIHRRNIMFCYDQNSLWTSLEELARSRELRQCLAKQGYQYYLNNHVPDDVFTHMFAKYLVPVRSA